ncbi:dihydrolipoamide dehydrogenase, putative [Syntrophotalea carbinolica DSM 2380]|uniref:Dihydrolipoamide dehydrogenase, putative n=1 Tax=Syntrophotalea carbinolica (strain DSM 2380 / NBRC 103641 / GraBd1) TaxID=338963 RepID=Q3A4H5_SYNC1|nr:dihydrolipoyl dehydrogenase [Syntrophotalea carbinolica]ABA88732.1 dihydrolipoamide dehydrogenase, putative [Syntrophotalea carbinolica DSM 2380]
MNKKVDVIVIGAGSAGLAAVRQIEKTTDNYLLIDQGPLGTTCARVGCMPSKAFIKVARDFHGATRLAQAGLTGTAPADCDIPAVLEHVRRLRNRFASGMVEVTRKLAGDRLIKGAARLLGPNRVLVNDEEITCSSIILATGSRPTIPEAWRGFSDRILTADTFFEQQDLPRRIAVVGLGIIGLELGQALARLGIEVTGFGRNPHICGIRDPEINRVALETLGRQFPLHVGDEAEMTPAGKTLRIRNGFHEVEVDAVIAALGVTPNMDNLGLENLGVPLDARGLPPYHPYTTQIGDLPVYVAGDANGCLPILHEAQDEGFIAGRNATGTQIQKYRRRAGLKIVFTDPQVAAVGQTLNKLEDADIIVARADFSEQSRAIAEGRNAGLMHLYVNKADARILGGEMIVPDAEHLAQLLALAIHREMTVHDMLTMPFYHPTVEEGLRTALRDAARQLHHMHSKEELTLCESCPELPLC